MNEIHIDYKTEHYNPEEKANVNLKHMAVSSLIGDNIINPQGESLGKIKDIMIDIVAHKVTYVVIEFGGFLGISQKYFAVPMQALTLAKEHRDSFILNETKESLKRYPGFDRDHWPITSSQIGHTASSTHNAFESGGTK